jgi:arylsulfatase A-like enzyme
VAPQTIDRFVINNDLAPTFLELAGAQADITIDGRSLIPLIENPAIQWRTGFLIETPTYSAIRTEGYVYAFHYKNSARELYDLVNDPYELQNVSAAEPWASKIAALDSWRSALVSCDGPTCVAAENLPAP